ncbi:DUF2238 domain-containing protein, partial [bacterium]|nr:DUF2238 domain-containing protein [bacterium]
GPHFRIAKALAPITICLLGLSLIDAPFIEVQHLQHTPTVLFIFFLFFAEKRKWLSPLSLVSATVFFWLHILGARWAYSDVPYDQWTDALSGFSLTESMGWKRNHYDRLVHFAFGLLATIPASEAMTRILKLSRRTALIGAFLFIGFASAAYEVFEWFITLVLSSNQSENYNGQQGDFFDAQKDMFLAILGSFILIAINWRKASENLQRKSKGR